MSSRLSVLGHSRNVHIKNIVVDSKLKTVNEHADPLDKIYEQAAPNAILNAGGRADDVRCYPGTREEVIRGIENWRKGEGEQPSRIMWLSGPAGAGKTAIVQTIAEDWKKRGVPAANFFFFRADRSRNTTKAVVTTLLYQLFDFLPTLKQSTASLLSSRPLATQASISDQFMEFINRPVHTLAEQQLLDGQVPIVILIDGLDECSSDDTAAQERVLQALQGLTRREDSPFKVLVSSRREPHLVMAFNKLSFAVNSVFLDDQYRPAEDIRLFVAAKFDEIKRSHHLSQTLGDDWPLNFDIDNITAKSSGQFIYAATVMRFLEHSPESPRITLKIVQGLQPVENHSPFAQLDAMYSYIFSQARNSDMVKKSFALHFISRDYDAFYESSNNLFDDFLPLFCQDTPLESVVAALGSVVQVKQQAESMRLIFYHASLDDFLQDESRSGSHFVNVHTTRIELIVVLLSFPQYEGLSLIIQRLMRPLENKSTQTSSQEVFEARLNIDTMKKIHDMFADSIPSLYKKFMRRWICLTLYNGIPPASHGQAPKYYRRYIYLTKSKLRILGLVCETLGHRKFDNRVCSPCMERCRDPGPSVNHKPR